MIPPASAIRPAGTVCTALLHTRNIAAASTFYRALFGWDVDGDETWASFMWRGERVAAARRVEHGDDGWIPLVGADDVDITTRAAVAAGGTSIETAASGPDGTPLSVISDPDGAIFGVCATSGRHVATLTEGAGAMWWVEALTNAPDVLQAFYGDLFQWRFASRPLSPHPLYVTCSRGSEPVAGLLPIGPEWGVRPRWQILFEVEQLDRAVDQVQAAGGRAEFGPLDVPQAGRLTSVRDADGALFVLVEAAR